MSLTQIRVERGVFGDDTNLARLDSSPMTIASEEMGIYIYVWSDLCGLGPYLPYSSKVV